MKKKSKMEMLAISTVNQKNQDPKQKTTHPHKSHQGTREWGNTSVQVKFE